MKYNIAVCREDDDRYPNELRNLKGMPSLLYYKGNIEIINQHKNIAAIGSRTLSEQGSKLAYRTGIKIAEEGFNLVNGLALGCDTLALKGALSVNGKCVVFLPCGLDRILPASNQKLVEEILEKGGCLLSEYPEKTAVQKYRYVERDRLQSGISQGVIVIEAEQNSGTMHTADFAMRQYKRLACYAYSLLQMSSGNQYLENTGKSTVLHDETGLAAFLDNIKQSQTYEQMKLPF